MSGVLEPNFYGDSGDPGKLEYLHNANWRGKLFSTVGTGVKPKAFCPGCRWPGEGRAHEGEACKLEARS